MKKITRLPYGWPTDKLTKTAMFGKWVVITHPDREPHRSVDGVVWERVKEKRQKVAHMYDIDLPNNVYLIAEKWK